MSAKQTLKGMGEIGRYQAIYMYGIGVLKWLNLMTATGVNGTLSGSVLWVVAMQLKKPMLSGGEITFRNSLWTYNTGLKSTIASPYFNVYMLKWLVKTFKFKLDNGVTATTPTEELKIIKCVRQNIKASATLSGTTGIWPMAPDKVPDKPTLASVGCPGFLTRSECVTKREPCPYFIEYTVPVVQPIYHVDML